LAALPPDVQKSLGYDPDKARAYEAQQKAAREDADKMVAKLRRASKVDARITQVIDDGLLVQLKTWMMYFSLIGNKTYFQLSERGELDWSGPEVFLSGVPNLQKRAEGEVMSLLLVERAGTYSFKDTMGAQRQVQRCEYLGTWNRVGEVGPQMKITVHYAGGTQIIPFLSVDEQPIGAGY
jgi:hypothetical protein